MLELNHYLPTQLPIEFQHFEQEVATLPVGTPGKLGAFRVKFRKSEEKTVVEDLFGVVPLRGQRAMYLDKGNPSMAFMFISHPSGGVLQGDRLRIDVEVREDAMANLMTQAATKIYEMHQNYATKTINITLHKGSYLEFKPDCTILFKKSRFYQETKIKIHEDASLLYWEMLHQGRIARGEVFEYDIYSSKIIVQDQEEHLQFMDAVVLQPEKMKLNTKGLLDINDFWGNIYVITKKTDISALSEEIHNMLQRDFSDCIGSSSILPNNAGLVTRILGASPITVRRALERSWSLARESIIGVPAPNVKKY